MTDHLNTLNKRIQGKDHFIFDLFQEITAFQLKLKLFHTQLRSENLVHFTTCTLFKLECKCDFSTYH